MGSDQIPMVGTSEVVDSKRYEAGLMSTRTPSSTELLSHVMGDKYEEENAHSSLLKHTPDKAGTIPLFAWSFFAGGVFGSGSVCFSSGCTYVYIGSLAAATDCAAPDPSCYLPV